MQKYIINKPNTLLITNLPRFINLYKFHVKFGFYKFVQKTHKFCVMVNINDICTYSIS